VINAKESEMRHLNVISQTGKTFKKQTTKKQKQTRKRKRNTKQLQQK